MSNAKRVRPRFTAAPAGKSGRRLHQAQRVGIRLALTNGVELPPADAVIEVFSRWIQRDALADQLLIDVVDYAHVHRGPNVLLIGHEAHCSLDEADGAPGLAYRERGGAPEPLPERVERALTGALRAAQLLEQEPLGLRFAADRLSIELQDRLHAPNSGETFAALQPLLWRQLERLYPAGGIELEHLFDPSRAFAVAVRVPDERGDVTALLGRLAGARQARGRAGEGLERVSTGL